MALAERFQNLTPRQRIAAGAAAAVIAASGAVGAAFEGTVFHSYPDPVLGWGTITACRGHTGPELRRGQTFTPAECDQMQAADLKKTYAGILSCIGDVAMPDTELTAYLDLAFNIGPKEFCNSSIPRKLKAGDHQAACETILAYRFVGGKDCAIASNNCAGIIRRRNVEAELCAG